MGLERQAERFLVDFLPALDDFSAHFAAPQWSIRTVAYNLVERAVIKENGRYALIGASAPIIMRGKEEDFSSRISALESRMHALTEEHGIEAKNAYAVVVRDDGVLYVPALEFTLEDCKILTTVGPQYLKVYFDTSPALPAKPFPYWERYRGLLGAADAHGHCLKFSPATLEGAMELDSKEIVKFKVSAHEGSYLLNSPIQMERTYLAPINGRTQQHLAAMLSLLGK